MRLLFFAFLFFPAFFYAAFPLSADEANGSVSSESAYITGISITGLKRTRLSTAEQPLRKFIGLKADLLDKDEVLAAIIAGGILDPVSVEVADGVLSVEVREKWSIFPVPVFFAGSGGMMAGLAFFDANALGLNDKLFVAGLYRSGGWSAAGGYIHSSPGGRVPGWNGMATFTREERHDRDQNNKDLRRFDLESISVNAGLGFPLLENSDLLTASPRVSFEQKNLKKKEDAVNGPLDDLRLFGAGAGLSLRRSSWDGFFLSQESASLEYFFKTDFDGFSYHSIGFRGVWEKSLIPGFRINLKSGLLFEPDAPLLFESSPYAAQVAILPGDFSARNYAGVSAGLEKCLIKIPAGTLSLAAAYQLVYSKGSVLGDSVDHGVMGMLVFYLNRLAIPALGLGAAYNVKENYLQGSFSLGMSF